MTLRGSLGNEENRDIGFDIRATNFGHSRCDCQCQLGYFKTFLIYSAKAWKLFLPFSSFFSHSHFHLPPLLPSNSLYTISSICTNFLPLYQQKFFTYGSIIASVYEKRFHRLKSSVSRISQTIWKMLLPFLFNGYSHNSLSFIGSYGNGWHRLRRSQRGPESGPDATYRRRRWV